MWNFIVQTASTIFSPIRTFLRVWIYNTLLVQFTTRLYHAVLNDLPKGSTFLDVGIGTGEALSRNASSVKEKDLTIVGVDIDADYVKACKKRLAKVGLKDKVTVLCQPVQEHEGGPYDAVYFSNSFMLIPKPAEVLANACKLLGPKGKVYFTQTFHEKKSTLLEQIKPLLKFALSVDFGRVTYESEFMETLEQAGVECVENATLFTIPNATVRMIVARPKADTVNDKSKTKRSQAAPVMG